MTRSDLKTDRQWRATTGYDQEIFKKLRPVFEEKHQEIFEESIEEIKVRSSMPKSVILSCEELLLFTLLGLKSGLTYDILDVLTGMDGTTAKRSQEVGIRVLTEVFQEEGYAPKRKFKTIKEFQEFFKDDETLIIDGTEQAMQRPKDQKKQKDHYSGRIKFMSYSLVGRTHDFTMLKHEFPLNKQWFRKHKIQLDLAYQGFEKDYICKKLKLSKKKPQGEQLSEIEKDENELKARDRVIVEHSLAGLKRYRILVNTMRLKDITHYDDILAVCAGLWSFYLDH